MAKIPLRMPMLPKETPTPIPIFWPVLPIVEPTGSADEVIVDGEENEEAKDEVAVGRLVIMIEFTDGIDCVGRTLLVIKSLL